MAVGACLREHKVPFILLEKADTVGASWRRHYERLHLHTVKELSALPGMPWPQHVPPYPSRKNMIEYLQRYSERFGLEPRFGTEVVSVFPDGSHWVTRTRTGEIKSGALVVATGYNRRPHLPTWPNQERFRGRILHSSEYRSGAEFQGKRVLVVGAGNSGGEIAMDLWEHGAETTLSVRNGTHAVPRDRFGLPWQVYALTFFRRLPSTFGDKVATGLLANGSGDLSRWGLPRPAVGPVTRAMKEGRIPLIDIGTVQLIQQWKIRVVPGPRAFTETGVTFADDRELPFDAVVLATGYRAGLEDFLDGAAQFTDERGSPRSNAPAPGLHLVGFRNPISGQLHDIATEAPRLARRLRGQSQHG
jgi:flavin-binding monooxygenase-like protein